MDVLSVRTTEVTEVRGGQRSGSKVVRVGTVLTTPAWLPVTGAGNRYKKCRRGGGNYRKKGTVEPCGGGPGGERRERRGSPRTTPGKRRRRWTKDFHLRGPRVREKPDRKRGDRERGPDEGPGPREKGE